MCLTSTSTSMITTATTTTTDTANPFPQLAQRAVCINLRERDDRMQEALKQFCKVGMEDTVKFHRVQRHHRGGRYGCYDSHRTVMQQALDDGIETLLVFEDDVQFHDGWKKVVKDAKKFIDSGAYFDAFFLGPQIVFVDEHHTPDVWRIKCTAAHAYVVSRAGMQAFLDSPEKFETDIQFIPQDVVQNCIWQHMYGPSNTEAITQDADLGTDNHWVLDVPLRHRVWFQTVLMPYYWSQLQPFIRSNLWRKSYFGRNYMIALDDYVIDDGRVRLQGVWWLDAVFLIIFVFCVKPPHGYPALFYDGLCMLFGRLLAFWRSLSLLQSTKKLSVFASE